MKATFENIKKNLKQDPYTITFVGFLSLLCDVCAFVSIIDCNSIVNGIICAVIFFTMSAFIDLRLYKMYVVENNLNF